MLQQEVGSIGETKSDEATAFNHDLVILPMRSRIALQLERGSVTF